MTYAAFTASRPDVAAGGATRSSEIGYARSNLTALADMLAAFAGMDNFNVTISAGTADVPTEVLATNGSQVVKVALTYGSGVTADLVTVVTLSKSTDSGSTYSSIRTCTITYDGSGDFVSTTWS